MWEDLQKHRKVEFDYINGEIISLAKTHNLDSPIHSKIESLIRDAESKKNGSPCYSADKLSSLLGII